MRAAAALGTVLALLAVAPLLGPLVELIEGETERWRRPSPMAAEARVEGDPASDEQVRLDGTVAGEPASVWLQRTPAGLVEQAPAGETLREANPLGSVEARMELAAGPATLDGPGQLSPRFPMHALVTVDEDDRFDEAWLRLDGDAWTSLEQAGVDGDRRVLRADVDAGVLAAGSTIHIDVVFDRHVAPDLVHRVHGPGWEVHAAAQGPASPELATDEASVRIEGEADTWQAQHRTDGGPWQPIPVQDGTVEVPEPGEVRVRGVDELGNLGPWSEPVQVDAEAEPSAGAEPWRLLAPEPGQRVAGSVAIDWRPAGTLVEVHAQPAEGGEPELVDRASEPPIRWRTGFVPDGDWRLHVRALEPDGWTSRVIELTVDNVEPVGLDAAGEDETEPPSAAVPPRTSSPWSAALATGAGLLTAGGLAARTWKRRPK